LNNKKGILVPKTFFTKAISIMIFIGGCSNKLESNALLKSQQSSTVRDENVLMHKSPLPYQAPQFDKVVISDYIPAFIAGMKQDDEEINAIVENSKPATFENTIVPMEKSGALLSRVNKMFSSMSGLLSDEDMIKIEDEIDPKLTVHNDNTYLNSKLFARIKVVYNHRKSLTNEQKRLVEVYYNNFVRSGAELSDANKTKLRKLNSSITAQQTKFSQNILSSFKNDTVLVTDVNELDGLSKDEIATLASAAKSAGKEGYMITLVNTTTQPILTHLTNRNLRQKIWEKSATRAIDTNGSLALSLAQLRAQKAKLLGYPTWAAYTIDDQMAKTPKAVFEMLDDLAPKAIESAKKEAEAIQVEIKKDGKDFEVQAWDWAYYAEKVRKNKYNLDEQQIKPYFEFNTVLNDGLFYAMKRLYGLTFKPRTDLPVWHEDVKVFEVFNKDKSTVGLFYLDPYAREGKNGGAWMDEFVTQSTLLETKPVVYNALNIPKPAEGNPTLLTFDEVTTMFHEFGHAVHGLFSNVKYPSVAGTDTPRDFVEFPSQFNEDWDINPEIISHYAKHYQTGKPIPKDLLNKILKSHNFNQGFDTTEYLAAALIDMEWHSISVDADIKDVNEFEKNTLIKHGLNFAAVSPRYKTSYFSHVFGGGYSAGYYAYLWTEVFAADGFSYMETKGGLNEENGTSFRESILSKGNSEDLMQIYTNYRGHAPTIDALLKRRGFAD